MSRRSTRVSGFPTRPPLLAAADFSRSTLLCRDALPVPSPRHFPVSGRGHSDGELRSLSRCHSPGCSLPCHERPRALGTPRAPRSAPRTDWYGTSPRLRHPWTPEDHVRGNAGRSMVDGGSSAGMARGGGAPSPARCSILYMSMFRRDSGSPFRVMSTTRVLAATDCRE